MADKTYEEQGLRLVAVDLGSELSFAFDVYDSAGGDGVTDKSFEIQGFRIKAHDNGSETYSPVVTEDTGVNDKTVELQGLRMKLHPITPAETVTIGGVTHPLYAIVVNIV